MVMNANVTDANVSDANGTECARAARHPHGTHHDRAFERCVRRVRRVRRVTRVR